MKKFLLIGFLMFASSTVFAQDTTSFIDKDHLSVETVVGTDLFYRGTVNGLIKYNIRKKIAVAAQTSFSRSYRSMGEVISISADDFKSINTTFSQKVGIGAVIGREKFHHTFLLMAGPKYYHLKETHNYDQFESTTANVSTWIMDAGLLYSLKIGKSDKYFSTQLYIPFLLIPDNLMGVTLSFGIGFQ